MTFRLKTFLESHPPPKSATNLDALFADPARAGTLLEFPINLPETVIADIRQGLATLDFNRYPIEERSALQVQLAEWLELPTDCAAVFGNGALDLIDLVLRSQRPGATAMTLAPDFWMYRLGAGKYGIELDTYALDTGFAIDTAEFGRQIRAGAPDLLILSNPHNPTSALFPPAVVESILRRSSGLVLIDEVYAPFAPEPNALVPLLGRYANLMILRSFSKVGAAAIRFGYFLGHKQVLERIDAWQTTFAVGSLSMRVAQSIIRHYRDIEAAVHRVVENREAMIRQLRELSGVVVYPSSTNFVVARLQGHDVAAVHRHMVAEGVKAIPCGGVPALENCLRFSVGTRAGNDHAVEQLLVALSRDRRETA